MLSRRILAGGCALCLLVPAAASAMPSYDPPVAFHGPSVSGDTLHDVASRHAPTAVTGYDVASRHAPTAVTGYDVASRHAPTAITGYDVASRQALAAGTGHTSPASITQPPSAPVVSTDDGTTGWRIAAVIEACVLAAFAVAAAVSLAGRQRRALGL